MNQYQECAAFLLLLLVWYYAQQSRGAERCKRMRLRASCLMQTQNQPNRCVPEGAFQGSLETMSEFRRGNRRGRKAGTGDLKQKCCSLRCIVALIRVREFSK